MNAMKNVLSHPVVRSVRYSQFSPLPSATWHIDCQMNTKYTPDVGKLEQKLAWLLFAYDNYYEGYNYDNIYTFTQHRFKMWRQDLGSASQLLVPVPVSHDYKDIVHRPVWADPNPLCNGNFNPLASRVRGHLHLISPEMIISLDKDMQNTVRFDRIRVPLYYPHQRMIKFRRREPQIDNVVGTVWAWMYVAKADYWEPLIDNPESLGLFKASYIQRPKSLWIGDYYTNSKE